MSLKRHLEILVVLLVGSCQTPSNWSPRIYVGAPDKAGVHRSDGKELVKCSQPDFKDYFCMEKSDLEKLYASCLDQKFSWLPK